MRATTRSTPKVSRAAGGQDVGVVAVGDGGDGGGLADAGLLEPVAVEPDPDHLPAAEPLVEPAEGDRVLVDHGDGVALVLDDAGQPRAGASAAR